MNLWKQVLDRLEQTIDRTQFETWFAPTRFLAQKGDTIDVSVPSQRFVSEIRQNYAQQIRMILDEMSTDHLNLHLVADTEGNSEMNIPLGPPPSAELPLSIFNARYRFETFVVGKSNELAYAASKSVAENPGGSFNPLFIYGGAGLGKTHLIQAIGQQLRDGGRSKVVYISADSFVTDFITSIRYDRMHQFRDRYRKFDAILLDDIKFMANKEQTQEEFFHTFNALYESQKQIVFTSDAPPKEIPTLEDRLRSRFEWGLIADIQPPDLETKLAILHSKLGVNGALIPEEVLSFIAHKVQRNIRELEGALTRVQAFAAVHQRQVDEEEAARLLSDIIPAGTRKPINVERIQVLVADYYNVTLEDMKGKRRDKHIVFPRQVAMFLVREETPSSLPAIGKAFGGRDHTTALHSIEKIANELKEDERLRYEVQSIREKLYVQ